MSSAQRHSRYLLEADVQPGTKAAALAAHLSRPPAARFRVEGSRAGNSRFLSKILADASARKYRGRVVEVFTIRQWREIKQQDLAACPTCEAPAGGVCKTKTGKDRSPHRTREHK